jgi:hypothetical protein
MPLDADLPHITSDYELHHTPAAEPVPEPVPTSVSPPVLAVWAIVALVIACGAAFYVAFVWKPHPAATAPAASTAPAATVQEAPLPLGGQAESIVVPPLDESDAVVRTLVRALSTTPSVAAWLTTSGLIRNFAVVVLNIADGTTPSKHLGVLRPALPFRIVERGSVRSADPRNDERYTAIANAVDSIDPAGAAKLYATLKPRLDEAYKDLGYPDSSFDGALERAIVSLLATPIPNGREQLKPKGIGYAYANDHLEDLTGAQKQLLRMGPRNARRVQAKLREVATALGIPASRLPPA